MSNVPVAPTGGLSTRSKAILEAFENGTIDQDHAERQARSAFTGESGVLLLGFLEDLVAVQRAKDALHNASTQTREIARESAGLANASLHSDTTLDDLIAGLYPWQKFTDEPFVAQTVLAAKLESLYSLYR